MLFLEYPKCMTCQKAKKWLDARGAVYTDRHIKDEPPTAEEIARWQKKSGLPLVLLSAVLHAGFSGKGRRLRRGSGGRYTDHISSLNIFSKSAVSAWRGLPGAQASAAAEAQRKGRSSSFSFSSFGSPIK